MWSCNLDFNDIDSYRWLTARVKPHGVIILISIIELCAQVATSNTGYVFKYIYSHKTLLLSSVSV